MVSLTMTTNGESARSRLVEVPASPDRNPHHLEVVGVIARYPVVCWSLGSGAGHAGGRCGRPSIVKGICSDSPVPNGPTVAAATDCTPGSRCSLSRTRSNVSGCRRIDLEQPRIRDRRRRP